VERLSIPTPPATGTFRVRTLPALLHARGVGVGEVEDGAADPRVATEVAHLLPAVGGGEEDPVAVPLDPDHGVPVEIRGTAEIVPDEDKRLPHELSHKYPGIDPPAEKDDEVRAIIRVVPRKIVGFSV